MEMLALEKLRPERYGDGGAAQSAGEAAASIREALQAMCKSMDADKPEEAPQLEGGSGQGA